MFGSLFSSVFWNCPGVFERKKSVNSAVYKRTALSCLDGGLQVIHNSNLLPKKTIYTSHTKIHLIFFFLNLVNCWCSLIDCLLEVFWHNTVHADTRVRWRFKGSYATWRPRTSFETFYDCTLHVRQTTFALNYWWGFECTSVRAAWEWGSFLFSLCLSPSWVQMLWLIYCYSERFVPVVCSSNSGACVGPWRRPGLRFWSENPGVGPVGNLI